jgi:ADP-heptose:LPS heptosyltransferase
MKPSRALCRIADLYFAARPGPARARDPNGVLLISSGGLGDTVLFAHVLPRFLELAHPGEPVTVLLRKNAAKMAFLFPEGVSIEAVDYDKFATSPAYRLQILRKLRAANYRLVISTDYLRHPELDDALVRATAAPQTIGMEPRPWAKHDRALLRNRNIYGRLFSSGPPLTDKVRRWAAFADWLTGKTTAPPQARLDEASLPEPMVFERPMVLIQAFSAVKAKQFPPALYARIVDILPEDWDVRLLGAPADMGRNPEFRVLLDPPRVAYDSTPFADLVPAMRAAKLVISVDTALMHLSVAIGAPTLCLASSAYVGEIVPYDAEIVPDNVTFLYHDMDCRGCLGDCIHEPESGMYPCVARLEDDRVIAAVRDMLAANGGDET